jgi:hypothetical protein
VLRIGTAPPYVRLGRDSAGDLFLSTNLAADLATRDSAGVAAIAQRLQSSLALEAVRRLTAAGTTFDAAARRILLSNTAPQSHTGTTTLDTIYSKVIPAGLCGNNSLLHVFVAFNASTQGATATTVHCTLGGTDLGQFTFAATGDRIMEWWMGWKNISNSMGGMTEHLATGAAVTFTDRVAGVNNAVDNTLALTVQNGTSTDFQQFMPFVVELVNTFGPV